MLALSAGPGWVRHVSLKEIQEHIERVRALEDDLGKLGCTVSWLHDEMIVTLPADPEKCEAAKLLMRGFAGADSPPDVTCVAGEGAETSPHSRGGA